MANSLVRIDLESNQYERGIKQAQKAWGDFTKSIGLSVSKFTAVGAAIGAVTGALKLAKDAFNASEQNLDAWGQTVQASESLYKGFLNSLNNGDISGFLSNINTITEAARAAYDALDNLGTFNAFNQINTQRTRTGLTEAMAGYRMGETSKGDVQKAAKAYQEELRTRQKLEQEAYSQAVRKVAAERGVPWGNLEQALSGSYGDYEKLKGVMPSGKRTVFQSNGVAGQTMSYDIPMAVTAQEKMGEALRKLTDDELQQLQALGAQAQRTGEEIAQVDKQLTRILNGKQPGTSGGSTGGGGGRSAGSSKSSPTYAADSIAAQEKLVQDLTSSWRNASEEMRSGYIPQIVEAETKLKEMKDQQTLLKEQAQGKLLGGNLMTSGLANESVSMSDFENQINAMIENIKINPIEIPIEATQKDIASITMAARTTADVVGSIGDAFSAIEDPAAKVMGTVMQAVASVALSYAQALVQAGSMGPWAWVAFAATGLATMLSTISAIHSATGYAQGGIVKGNSYSGDNIYCGPDAMVNAGELVLTRAQQGNLASQLEGGGMRNMNLSGRIRGTDIILSVDRTLSLEGKQLLTWGR
jgi:hypothetical protein